MKMITMTTNGREEEKRIRVWIWTTRSPTMTTSEMQKMRPRIIQLFRLLKKARGGCFIQTAFLTVRKPTQSLRMKTMPMTSNRMEEQYLRVAIWRTRSTPMTGSEMQETRPWLKTWETLKEA
ncbi:hypothetical protein M758_UG050000 [Ceratodon purpureus]|nr:hypothetical protein M758_UG050000 [Ceratodon purpureus]